MSLKGISVASLTNPDKDGYLTKQGGSIKTWRRRWCVLKDGTIYYFKTPKDTTPKGTIELETGSEVEETEIKKKEYAFTVTTNHRTFYIIADTDSAKAEWMAAIKRAIAQLREKSGGGGGGGGGSAGGASSAATSTTTTAQNANGTAGRQTENNKSTDQRQTTQANGTAGGHGGGASNKPGDAKKDGAPSARKKLAMAKNSVPFLAEPDSKVLEFWQIWSESIPPPEDLSAGMGIEYQVVASAGMQKLTWRTAGPQNVFIQKMVDFFWNVGAPESEIDRLNDVGALINPIKIGSWIDMSGKGGMDGGWFFPVEVSLSLALEAADAGYPVNKVKDWAQKNGIDKCYSVGRDMGAAPPRQTEIRVHLPGADFNSQLRVALDAFEMFGFPELPEGALKVLRANPVTGLRLSIITSSDGFVRLGVLVPNPIPEAVVALCDITGADKDALATFEGALGSDGPIFAEYQYLMRGFGYNVYKEGFDVVFHYDLGEEVAPDE